MGPLHWPCTARSVTRSREKLLRDTLDMKQRTLGLEHRSTLVTTENLAVVLGANGRYFEAEQLLRQVLEGERRTLGAES
jgi:hypothetical protein